MANENETHEKVCKEIQECCNCWKGHKRTDLTVDALQDWHDRLVAAHKREIEDLKSLDTAHRNLALRAVEADNKKKEEIAKRDALIKKLSDDLNNFLKASAERDNKNSKIDKESIMGKCNCKKNTTTTTKKVAEKKAAPAKKTAAVKKCAAKKPVAKKAAKAK